ncbi:Retrovirus-related Pol polyprotein from transposon TNT 1-94 [Dendrobium catenatum]|uniref:Retrovirus-related Pol polyprotein from transposon TNT 1-94 n=1 Tax=Dendrobium catenatum TaxID=906689 RepID=A0A2I0VPH2_9ASPA|nr:Retrovirus-related Pol polyprotein from transposon TNT 1-94 [Dendrobium catenatum]
MKHGVTINEHLNDFTNMLAYLLNLDEDVGDEDKALLLLNSLSDEYENFTMSLIHRKEVLNYGEVTIVPLNHEFWCRDKESAKINSAEALTLQRRISKK